MDKTIKYRIGHREDYPAVLLLYNRMYKSNRSLRDFEWLIERNPAGKAILFIALLEGEVVGMQSLIPYVFIQNGSPVKTYKSEDTLVEQNLRGKGIFSRLYEMVHAYAGETLVWGLTDKKEILERVNMPSSAQLTIVVSVKKPLLSFKENGFQKYVMKTVFYSYLYLKSTFSSKQVTTNLKLQAIKTSHFENESLQSFFRKVSFQNPKILFPSMDPGYLNWRLIENPNLEKYQIVCSFNSNNEIEICSIIGFKGKSAYWQSFYADSETSETEKIGHIVQLRNRLFNSGVNLIHSWLFECNPQVNAVKQCFYQSGFAKVRDGLWIVHNSSNLEIDVHNLYFSPQLGIR